MIQFYFLSILFNAASGYVLVSAEGGDDKEYGISGVRTFLGSDTTQLILGILTMVTGLLKLLSPTVGDLPIIGDLIPALVGFLAGFILVFGYYRSHSVLEDEKTASLSQFLVKNRRWIGFIAIAASALHFLFPAALLL
jgi:uncharacterized membrane-anchored protein